MTKIVSIDERFQHFLSDIKESFWGDLEGRTKLAWKHLFESESERLRDRYAVLDSYERGPRQVRQYRNGYYERDFATRFGTIRLRIARARGKSFLPPAIEKFQRRAPELAMLIREAFLRGISTRQVGRVVATLTGEMVSAQTVSNLTRDLDHAVKQFHQAPLKDEWAYLFLDGVNLKVRRPAGRQCVQMLVAYGVRQDGTRQLLGFLRTKGESQANWEALLNDLYRRGLKGDKLQLIVTDGCPGLAAAIQTVFPRAAHQRCWVHKMRNILEKVRKRDYDAVKTDAQAIYLADGPPPGGGCRPRLQPTLAKRISVCGQATGTRSARTAGLFPIPKTPLAQAAHHQYHRALFRRSPPQNQAHGLLRQRAVSGPNHLLHLPEIQPGMENPHPPSFYTSGLTSPLKSAIRVAAISVLPLMRYLRPNSRPWHKQSCSQPCSPPAAYRTSAITSCMRKVETRNRPDTCCMRATAMAAFGKKTHARCPMISSRR